MLNDDEWRRHQQKLRQADLSFREENSAKWVESINESFGDNPPKTIIWDNILGCKENIQPFIGESLNHTMLPNGGGLDMKKVKLYHDAQIIEFIPGDNISYIFKFGNGCFEYIRESPVDSFFLLEAAPLEKTDVYEEVNRPSEELVEIEEGHYEERAVWDSGMYFDSRKGREARLPRGARLVQRYLRGKFLIVAKASLWNRTNSTYDGRHNRMNAFEIREVIERAVHDGARQE